MNITKENIDSLSGIIRVNIEEADYQANVEKALSDYRKKANMPGFRPGKVPQGLVKKMYGKAALADEVNKLLSDGLSKFIVDKKLDILGEPLPHEELQQTIDWDNDTNFEFVFEIGYAPEVKISLDKRTKLPYYKVNVSNELIDRQVESYAARFGENKPVDAIEKDSTVRGDIVQLDENNAVAEGGHSQEMGLISVDLIKDEEIKNSFVGKNAGDEIIFDIKKAYPNDTEIAYLLNIEKKDAENVSGNFKFTVKEINKFVAAELTEEHYKKILGEETQILTAEAFREHVANELSVYYKPSADYKLAIDARELLINKIKMEFPEGFLKRWLLATNKELTQEQIDADFAPFMEDLRWQVIKENIIKENELKVSQEDVMELAKDIAASQFRQYGMFDIPEEHLEGFARQMLEKKDERNRLYSKKMEDKVIEVIKSKVGIEEKEVTNEEFEKLFEKK
ncbi:MAG TPA: trigger factor [Prolixibacteraceae bacterium]|nr:trigger factor [Prolixibacteraceae bacterium]HQN93399.1 trigger factor [Prolixibacteraceae bacterium]HUM88460.1 trigger factor [Prolixibacteraceae bacterium]